MNLVITTNCHLCYPALLVLNTTTDVNDHMHLQLDLTNLTIHLRNPDLLNAQFLNF